MALILEDGSGKTNSQTYVLGADVAAYARLYGLAPSNILYREEVYYAAPLLTWHSILLSIRVIGTIIG